MASSCHSIRVNQMTLSEDNDHFKDKTKEPMTREQMVVIQLRCITR